MYGSESLVRAGLHSLGKTFLATHRFPRREFWVRLATLWLSFLGLASAVLTLLGSHFSPRLAAVCVSIALAIAAAFSWPLLRRPHLPDIDIYQGRLRVRCPCSIEMAHEVGDLAQHYYGSASIAPERYEQLRVKNPLILACLTNGAGEFLGYFDIIPLKHDFAHMFRKGIVTESQMTHEDVQRRS